MSLPREGAFIVHEQYMVQIITSDGCAFDTHGMWMVICDRWLPVPAVTITNEVAAVMAILGVVLPDVYAGSLIIIERNVEDAA